MSEPSGRGTLTKPPQQRGTAGPPPRVRRPEAAQRAPEAVPQAPPLTGPRTAPHTGPHTGSQPRPHTGAQRGPQGAPRSRKVPPRATNRMPFIVLLCGLLGGALVSALVISTTLATGAFKIAQLQQSDSQLAKQQQQLEEEVATAQSAQMIEQRAYALGMRPVGELEFLNLKNGKVQTDAGSGGDSQINVPGYTP